MCGNGWDDTDASAHLEKRTSHWTRKALLRMENRMVGGDGKPEHGYFRATRSRLRLTGSTLIGIEDWHADG